MSKATKGLASGRASSHKKNIATKKGDHDCSPQKADPCSGKKALKRCDDDVFCGSSISVSDSLVILSSREQVSAQGYLPDV